MNRNNSNPVLITIENLVDMLLNLASMAMAYVLAALLMGVEEELPSSPRFIFIMLPVVVIQSLVFLTANLHRPISSVNPGSILFKIFRVNTLYLLAVNAVLAFVYEGGDRKFVLIWIAVSYVIGTALLVFKKRMIIRFVLFLRKRRYNIRKVIIVGNNMVTAAEFINQVSKNSESGMVVIGYVGDKRRKNFGVDCLGSFDDLADVLDRYRPHDVVFAVDVYSKKKIMQLVSICDDRCIKVYFLPVIYGYFKSPKQIESVGTLPVINIHSTPLDLGWNAFMKRTVDVIGALVLIVLTSPIMLVAAIGVYLTSPGPILFKQERVGKMGKTFKILKFRSMKVNVSSNDAWSTGIDTRKTRFGNFIRKTSIDELPQLFNVLAGSMSLVGPRPEVPKFVDYFKTRVPLYMVKHYVKPGITGLAQIKGLRGDTSITDRIQEDISYIENWSLGLDISILLQTPFKAINRSEKFTATEENDGAKEEEELEEEFIIAEQEETEVEKKEPLKCKGKILYAASTMSHINNFHLEYIDALRRDGYVVKVMANGQDADYGIPFEKKFISSSNAACRVEIRKILEKERFDIVVLNTSLAAYQIRRCLPREHRPRVVNFVHGYLFSKDIGLAKRLMLLMAEKSLAKKTDTVIVMNEQDRRIATKHKLCLGEVLFCRGMGAYVKEQTVSPERIRHELGCDDKFVMAFVGELSSRKNQEFLIYALNEIKEYIPNAVLWLVGDGLGREHLTRLAGKVDVSESVFLLGKKENACDYMRACDLYVSASTIEGMPFNLIEAMGCGKTVLASKVKGHEDLIEDGISGYLYKAGDEDGFVKNVVAFHKGEMKLDTERIIARYKEFSKEEVFEDTLETLKEAFK